MEVDTDFNALYKHLGVFADCSIEQFKQAYRRRVAHLHPDRAGTDDGLARLQQLNRSYAQALEFHRRHGRLPGTKYGADGRAPPALQAEAAARSRAVAGTPHHARYSVLVALVTLVLLWLYQSNSAGPQVVIGMKVGDVLAIQGEPSTSTESRVHYGPSWIEFRCGKVVDWYSSPRQSLRVEHNPALGGKPVPSDPPAIDC